MEELFRSITDWVRRAAEDLREGGSLNLMGIRTEVWSLEARLDSGRLGEFDRAAGLARAFCALQPSLAGPSPLEADYRLLRERVERWRSGGEVVPGIEQDGRAAEGVAARPSASAAPPAGRSVRAAVPHEVLRPPSPHDTRPAPVERPAGLPFRLRVPREVFRQMADHAAREEPRMCVGLLTGKVGGSVATAVRCRPTVNQDARPGRFETEPASLLTAMRGMVADGHDLLAVYTSVVGVEPVPSRECLGRHIGSDVVRLILPVGGGPADVRAWWLSETSYREAEWEFAEDGTGHSGAVEEAGRPQPRDPLAMLDRLRGGVSARRMRLFAVACCLDGGAGHMPVAERHADGEATDEELALAAADAEDRHRSVRRLLGDYYTRSLLSDEEEGVNDWREKSYEIESMAHATAVRFEGLFNRLTELEGRFPRRYGTVAPAERQAGLIQRFFGDPSRPATVLPAVLAWDGGTVPRLARAVYKERAGGSFDPALLGVLADALEEAGADSELVAHCRSAGPHYRGSWLVDLLLGKE